MPDTVWWTTTKAVLWLWGLVTLVGITGGVSDIWIARWAESGDRRWLLAAFGICVLSLWLFGWLIKTDSRSLSHLLMLATLTHVLQVVVYEVAVRGHRPSPRELTGLLLGLLALMFLEWQSPDTTVANAAQSSAQTSTHTAQQETRMGETQPRARVTPSRSSLQ